jgi:hypothetical protein
VSAAASLVLIMVLEINGRVKFRFCSLAIGFLGIPVLQNEADKRFLIPGVIEVDPVSGTTGAGLLVGSTAAPTS